MHNLNAVLLAAEMEPRLFDLDFQLLADSPAYDHRCIRAVYCIVLSAL